MTIEVCPFHADEGIRGVLLADDVGTETFECDRSGHPHAGPWRWSRVPAPPEHDGVSGLAAELGLDVELPAAVASYDGRWVEYGLVERAYALAHPEGFQQLIDAYGHTHLQPSQYTASAYLARTLGDLSRVGTVLFHSGRGTGRWSYNTDISYWAVAPVPDWKDRLTWATAGVDVDYVSSTEPASRN